MNHPIKADSKWSRACLRVFSDILEPEDIGRRLGLTASRSHRKGAPRSSRVTLTWNESLWSLQSPLSQRHGIADHVQWLLDTLEPKTDSLTELLKYCRIDLLCGFSSGNGQCGVQLDPLVLKRLARLTIPFVIVVLDPNVPGAGPFHHTSQDLSGAVGSESIL